MLGRTKKPYVTNTSEFVKYEVFSFYDTGRSSITSQLKMNYDYKNVIGPFENEKSANYFVANGGFRKEIQSVDDCNLAIKFQS